jgi:hypothetical protein
VVAPVSPRLALDGVSVISPADKRVQILASAFSRSGSVPGRVYRTAIEGYYFDDVYFYKLPVVATAA